MTHDRILQAQINPKPAIADKFLVFFIYMIQWVRNVQIIYVE